MLQLISLSVRSKSWSQVNRIAHSFTEIITTDISNRIINDVSAKLTQQVVQNLKVEIETGAKETAETLSNKAFQHLSKTLQQTKNEVESGAKEFHREVISTYQNDLKQLKAISSEIQQTADKSNRIYMQREEAYQNHVSQEKASVKKNWILIACHSLDRINSNCCRYSLRNIKISWKRCKQSDWLMWIYRIIGWKMAFVASTKKKCNAYMPKQQFMQNRPIDFCYFSKTPAHQVQTQHGYLNIFTK